MPDITLERGHTAVLIADFYAQMMNTLPLAPERGVVENAAAVQAAVEDCCLDSDTDVHDFLTQRILTCQAGEVGSGDVIRALDAL
ncbi:MAG: hypothetical protein IH872_13730 [Chloroflexi bacterium]|nr:hypothetical protein [Chloroflexota bacterium]